MQRLHILLAGYNKCAQFLVHYISSFIPPDSISSQGLDSEINMSNNIKFLCYYHDLCHDDSNFKQNIDSEMIIETIIYSELFNMDIFIYPDNNSCSSEIESNVDISSNSIAGSSNTICINNTNSDITNNSSNSRHVSRTKTFIFPDI